MESDLPMVEGSRRWYRTLRPLAIDVREENERLRVKAEEAFTSLLDEGASVLDAELFPNTFEALGSTYDPNDVRSIPPHNPNHASLER